MIFPLEQLVKFSGNVYEITVAASRRAYQLAMMKDAEIDRNDGKVVSLAAKQIFNNTIQYIGFNLLTKDFKLMIISILI